jgi:ABC-type glycerol-3-phosphate transport system permease component
MRRDNQQDAKRPWVSIWAFVGAVFLAWCLYYGAGRRDAVCFAIGIGGWLIFAHTAQALFTRFGHWFLIGFLLLLALPLYKPLRTFEWERYAHFVENYRYAWNEGHVGEYFVNSLMVTVTTVALTTFFGATAAYVLARRELAGQSLVLGTIIGSITIPGILIQVPLFLLIKDWGFVIRGYQYSFMDSRLGLAIIYTAISLPFTIYVMAGFFKTLPGTLGEAAVIDGCGPWRTFSEIYLPLVMPGIATTGIFNFLGAWNEFNLGLIFMSNPNFKTLPIGLYELQAATQYSSAWSPMFAGIVLLCLPTFLIFIFLQERIVEGLMSGGVKG